MLTDIVDVLRVALAMALVIAYIVMCILLLYRLSPSARYWMLPTVRHVVRITKRLF